MEVSVPVSQHDWDQTPAPVRNLIKIMLSDRQVIAAQKQRLMDALKARYFPESTFVGPFEKLGVTQAVLVDQWLYKYRHLVRGDVLDMSTPMHFSEFLRAEGTVKSWRISNYDGPKIAKLGYESVADIVGDFCAVPPPVEPESFDTILSISILEHCKDPAAMMKNLGRMLRPGGTLLILLPYAAIDGHQYPDYWRIGRDGLYMLTEEAGLKVVEYGDFVDLGKYYLMEFGWSAEANGGHRGIPFNNWIIAQRPGI